MDDQQEKRQIKRFLNGKHRKPVDAFHIYQWIERCHFQKWWKLAIELSSSIPPNSLDADYQRRLDVICKDCRTKQDEINRLATSDDLMSHPSNPRQPIRKTICGKRLSSGTHPFVTLNFDNDAKQTLREIYSVLYYMQKNYDFVDAVRRTKDNFNITYQAVDDKCARRFAGTVDVFQRWYVTGEVLQKLRNHFHLSHHDYEIFEEMLTKKLSR